MVFFGTHLSQSTGYAKVIFELLTELDRCASTDLEVSLFGFQSDPRYSTSVIDSERRRFPSSIRVFDAAQEAASQTSGDGNGGVSNSDNISNTCNTNVAIDGHARSFGIHLIAAYLKTHRPDVIVIFNDLLIISNVLSEVQAAKADANGSLDAMKVITYIDQVYDSQPRALVEKVNTFADAALVFTPGWERCIRRQGLTIPCTDLPHGFNPMTYFPVPKQSVRGTYFGCDNDTFVVLNLNRNQPRKRWDICLQAWAAFVAVLFARKTVPEESRAATDEATSVPVVGTGTSVKAEEKTKTEAPTDDGAQGTEGADSTAVPSSRSPAPAARASSTSTTVAVDPWHALVPPVKLIVGAMRTGGWDMLDVYKRELDKFGVPSQVGARCIGFVNSPQSMTDREVNLLYNACDVGINTCDGEGFGLCNLEHAGVGKPQIVSAVGGLREIFDEHCAQLVEPVASFYADSSRSGIGGEARMCRHTDFARALLRYFDDKSLRETHGARARAKILSSYRWSDAAQKVKRIILDATRTVGSTETNTADPGDTAGPSPSRAIPGTHEKGTMGIEKKGEEDEEEEEEEVARIYGVNRLSVPAPSPLPIRVKRESDANEQGQGEKGEKGGKGGKGEANSEGVRTNDDFTFPTVVDNASPSLTPTPTLLIPSANTPAPKEGKEEETCNVTNSTTSTKEVRGTVDSMQELRDDLKRVMRLLESMLTPSS